jgi:hypothetical protein
VCDSIQPPPRCSGRSLPLHYAAFHPLAAHGGRPRRRRLSGGADGRSCALNVKLNQRIIDEFQLRVRRRFDRAHTRAHRVTHACVLLVAAATHSPHCPDSRQPPDQGYSRGTTGTHRTVRIADSRFRSLPPVRRVWARTVGHTAAACRRHLSKNRIASHFVCLSGARACRTGRRRAFDRTGVADPNADRRRSKRRHPPSRRLQRPVPTGAIRPPPPHPLPLT